MKCIDHKTPADVLAQYVHLVEYQSRPADLPQQFQNFKPRDSFPMGQLLCGDLVINEEKAKQLEVHPFPEWVVQLVRIETDVPSVNGYCIALNMEQKEFKKFAKKDWRIKKDDLKGLIKDVTADGLVAFKMGIGICLKVQASVPHYFVSAPAPGGNVLAYPYCQVFEPTINWDKLAPFGKFEPTAYFSTDLEIRAP